MSKLYKVIGIRFSGVGKTYYFDPRNFNVGTGDNVIVETARGLEYGTAVTDIKEVSEGEIVPPLKPIQRMATDNDKKKLEDNKKAEKDALKNCEEKVVKHNLPMKLLNAEYTFDRGKIIFYFTAGSRVDFRELVKDLASIFKTRIELRQVGVRDEAKHLGGYGSCGRNLCCSSWLSEFETISIKMAKNQNISPNPTKINGVCGRLMCCLKYEDESYTVLRATFPKEGSYVETPMGRGKVIKNSFFTKHVTVILADGGFGKFSLDETDFEPAGFQEIVVSPEEEKLDEDISTD
ncbi:MAG: PSP1 domain-containing protein [Fusobacteria bacterium]|nr:MAG: PSP1 domain-containing protein [Fusobacteriota bacterium]KAF0228781.1 MAG: PSP1 domain-containing [Fusobacteriota bacterium]